jgi:hypothetical protein
MTKLYNTETILHNKLTTSDPIEAYIEEVCEHLAELPENAECIGDLVELFDDSPNPFIRCDEFGHIIYANRASGFAGSGRGKAETLPEFLLQPCLRAIETKSSQVCEVEYDFQKNQFVLVPFQNYTYVNIHGKALVKDLQSEIERLKMGIAKSEKEIKCLAEQLLQARENDKEKELTRGAINDLSSSITAINGYVELCRVKTERTDPRNYFLQKIKNLLENVAESIRHLMLYNRKGPLEKNSSECNKTIEESIETKMQKPLTPPPTTFP